jgi:hypothetical protein
MTRRMRMNRESDTQDERESLLYNDPLCVCSNESLNDVCADTDTDMHTHRIGQARVSLLNGDSMTLNEIRHTDRLLARVPEIDLQTQHGMQARVTHRLADPEQSPTTHPFIRDGWMDWNVI